MGSLPPASTGFLDLAKAKREAVFNLIPQEWRLPTPLPSTKAQKDVTGAYVEQYLESWEIDITRSDAIKIVEQTTSGKWTATEVVQAFCHRAALAHQLTNCLHEIFFDQAITDAKLLDERFAKEGSTGPLHGLPISFKDQFHVRGVETTMGYVGWIGTFEGVKGTGKEKVAESELVREARALGAIPFCKTSLPHTVMSLITWNHIVETTYNPSNRLMTCGGSSGGEGALISMKGSPLGVGTDIGGSIRIPAAFNGLYGIRPSFGRLPYIGAANSMPGQNTIPSVCGPLAPTPGSLKLLIKSALTQQPWLQDPAVVELPWREELEQLSIAEGPGLTFGFYASDTSVSPQPPVKRALEMVKTAILQMGHHIVEWNPPSHEKALQIAFEAFTQDGGIDVHHHLGLSGETLQEQIKQFYGDEPSTPKTGDFIQQTNIALRKYQKEYMDYWNSVTTPTGRAVDAILTPVAPYAALQLGTHFGRTGKSPEETETKEDALKAIAYTPWVNALDYTAVVIPVSKVDATVDKFDPNYQPLNEVDRSIWENFDPDIQHGTPIGVQLVGRRLQEEKMIAIAEMFEKAFAAGKGLPN